MDFYRKNRGFLGFPPKRPRCDPVAGHVLYRDKVTNVFLPILIMKYKVNYMINSYLIRGSLLHASINTIRL